VIIDCLSSSTVLALSALPMYNLACALSRLRDAHTEKALTLAVSRGGAAIKEKARKDADFDGVRGEPWFTALTR
jgi:hypothetical protein